MNIRASHRSRTLRRAFPVTLALLLGCAGGDSSSTAPLIGATVVGFTPGAAGAALGAGASVQVLDASTGAPVTRAVVTVNGIDLPYDATTGAYEGAAPVTARSPVEVSVTLGGRSYRATGQLDAYPAVTSPSPGDSWSALAPHAITWQAGAPLAEGSYMLGVVDGDDPNGTLVWPADQQFQEVPTTAASFQLQPGSLTGGDRVLVVGLVTLGSFPGAAYGSGMILAAFDAVPVTVTVGTPLASGPGPVNLLASGGRLLWSDGDAPVKSIPAGGGPVVRVVERHGVPESVKVVGSSLYWIAGEQLLRSTLDGSSTEVIAHGYRNTGGIATAAEVIVDEAAAYWINTVPDPSCSPACRWAIVRAPLDGTAPATLVTTRAEIKGLAADATTIYWVQEGTGPVSADGNAPTDSAVGAVPKVGGAAVTLVNGLLNGPPRVLPPGYLPGNWFSRGGLIVAGDQLYFADTTFYNGYRVLRVAVTGGAVTELQKVAGSNSAFVREMVTDGATLFWADDTSVKSLPLAGGAAVNLASGIYQPTGLAVAAGRVVWSETECCAVRQNGSVRSVPADGGVPLVLADLLDNPAGVTADADAAYWVEGGAYGAIEGYGRIASALQDGGGATTVLAATFTDRPPLAADGERVVLADGWRAKAAPLAGGPLEVVLDADWSVTAVASDGVHVYALDGYGSLLRAPLAGGQTEVVFSGTTNFYGSPGPLRIAGGYAYWVAPDAALRRVSLAGGAAETIATGLPGLSDLAVDGAFAYLAPASGQLQSVPVSGGVPTVLGKGEYHAAARLALDGGRLYWIETSRLGRITLATGEEQVLAVGLEGDPALGNAVAVDAAGLYWTESGSGMIKRCDDR